ncbi:unnamed protein product [Aspergillus oryzae]|uniref:Unnamed protein product n=2 Tax=Aspergillus oryzae TaxID=5062 RepID=A0AAN4Z076_ASPOZ|nr:unnamed protein product [Aspergillus oryzae]GMF95023.1 unnamed protein product [Aspergillus oryzae]GMG17219.1 unnamed protein product [Aspergillus oryzae]GMG38779.1 unnamed protein product [Aspergillus oryzae]GMG54946.1 unnamed protein product [Aspergillus oryzae var. brunneus]
MTTDTAVRVTRMVVHEKGSITDSRSHLPMIMWKTNDSAVPLEKIQYVDYPEILINEHERTEMPFRYVRGDDGQPIMPQVCTLSFLPLNDHLLTDAQGMVDLIKEGADQGIGDLF